MKKALSLILCILLAVSVFPFSALALEDGGIAPDDEGMGFGQIQNPTFDVQGGVLVKYNGKGVDVVIPAGVTSIGKSAFSGCKTIKSIVIPNGITSIGEYAFNDCTSLEEIFISKSVKTVSSYAFDKCTALKKVWYSGTQSEKSKMSIANTNNTALTSAEWNYLSCSIKRTGAEAIEGVPHDYGTATPCGKTCAVCGEVCTNEHYFPNSNDKNDDTYHWTSCALCGIIKSGTQQKHDYVNDCDTKCEICGKTRPITHSYENEHNTVYHWRECSVCHTIENNQKDKHTYDNNCDEVCNGCEYQRTPPHTPSSNYQHNASQHWTFCADCNEPINVTAHDWQNACDTKCDTCGETRTVPHSYTTVNNGTHHWEKCTLCLAEKTGSEQPHSYTDNCDKICNNAACGYERVAPHSFGTAWSSDEDFHFHKCAKCDARKDQAAHEFGNDDTCDVAGCGYVREHIYDGPCDETCNKSGCGYVRPDAHTYTKIVTSGKTHWLTCSLCAKEKPNSRHEEKYTDNCDKDCNTCGFVRTPPHTYTPNKYGSTDTQHWLICNGCGATKDTAEHKYDNSCDTACNICGKSRTVIHKYGSNKDANYHWQECEICKVQKDKVKHTYAPATCLRAKRCDCGATIGASLGHSYSNGCDTTCNRCGHIRSNITHTHSSNCDTQCNVCKASRVTSTKHTYDYTCDSVCNLCSETRSASHDYSSDCDATCNICLQQSRAVTKPHRYDGANDLTCNSCGAKRATGGHFYDNASDMICNGCGYNRGVPSAVTSDKVNVTGNTISKIPVGTTAATLLSSLSGGKYCKVYKDNKEISSTTVIGTGMVVKILDGNTVKSSYTVVVTGDTNGDGKISVTDMVAVKSHILSKSKLTGSYLKAADTSGDGNVSITDFVQVKASILGKGSITAR